MIPPGYAWPTPWWRRRRTIVLAVVVLAVVAGAITFNVAVLRYQPVEAASSTRPVGGREIDLTTRDPEHFGLTTDDAMSATVFDARPGRRFSYAFDIVNEGGRDVRIINIALIDSSYVEVVGVALDDDPEVRERGGSPRRWQRFEAFTLEAGTVRYVRFKYRFAECGRSVTAPTTVGVEAARIEYEVLGIGRSGRVGLLEPLVVRAKRGWCENR